MNLSASFKRLIAGSLPSHAYLVESIPAAQETYVAASSDGRPALFIAVARQEDSPGIRLRNLELRHGARGDLRTPDGHSVAGTYTLVECLSYDSRLQQAFLELASEVLNNATPWNSTLELQHSFASMVELFQAAALPSQSAWIGAWGELFLMHSSTRPEELLACWHSDQLDLHDFALNMDRLECKTTTGQSRIHQFSLGQLDESDHSVFVASVVTHETLSGVSALTLYDQLRNRVKSRELRVHLDSMTASMLGSDLDCPGAPKFDYEEARQSLRVLPAKSIPAPTNPFPNHVSSVAFRADVSECPDVVSESPLLRLLG